MNTKQLVVAWFAVLIVAVILFGYAWGTADGFSGALSASLGVFLLAGAFIYTFSNHNQADNKRVALVVIGGLLCLGAVVAGMAVLAGSGSDTSGSESSMAELERDHDSLRSQNALRDSIAFRNVQIEAREGSSCSPFGFVRDDCIRVSLEVVNRAGRTLTSFGVRVVISDTLGNQVEEGDGRIEVRLAPGESATVSAMRDAVAYLGDNRVPSTHLLDPRFLRGDP